MTTDEIICEYQKAFQDVYGFIPKVVKSGSWLYTVYDDEDKAMRSKDLVIMTNELKRTHMLIQHRKNMKKLEPRLVFGVSLDNWKNVDPEIIQMFLQTLFDRCSRSEFKMEESLKEFILGRKLLHGLKTEPEPDPDCEGCIDLEYYLSRTEELEDEIIKLERTIEGYEEETDDYVKELEKADKKYKELKEKSVLFSMDEI